MAILVYKLTCGASGKSYVGITARALDTRWLEHCARTREGNRPGSRLYNAMRKYGFDAFTREIIATADTEDEARSLEKHFIIALDTYANGYNANEGGHGWLRVPDDVRRKISEAQKGKFITPLMRQHMAAAQVGRTNHGDNFGEYRGKGDANPLAESYLMRFPDGTERVITGLRAFCRETGARNQVLRKGYCSFGYSIVRKVTSIYQDIRVSPEVLVPINDGGGEV